MMTMMTHLKKINILKSGNNTRKSQKKIQPKKGKQHKDDDD